MRLLQKLMPCGFRSALACLLAFDIAGCAIHPLPENVTGLDTRAIVEKIRCEARIALQYQVKKILRDDRRATLSVKQKWIDLVDNNIRAFAKQNKNDLEPRTIAYMDKYDDYLIYFDFTLTSYEDNNVATEINLLSTLTRGTDGLNLKASNNRKRQNVRNFRVRHTFKEILDDINCSRFTHNPDYMYPITGEIGLQELINTFLELNEGDTLTPKNPKDSVQLFADTLSFTTVSSGTASPKIVLSPVGKPLSLADAGFTATATRSDAHEVLVGISLPLDTPSVAKAPAAQIPVAIPYGAPLPTRAYREQQLDFFIDQQIRRNLILNLGTTRGATLGLFPGL